MDIAGAIPYEPVNQRIAGIIDVLTSQSCRELCVAGCNSIEDGVMLPDDVVGTHKLAGLNLAYAQLDLAHQKIVHSGKARAGLSHDERSMEVEISPCEGRAIIESGVLDQVAVNRQSRRRQAGCLGEITNSGSFENRTVPVQVVNVVATQLRYLRGVMRATGK